MLEKRLEKNIIDLRSISTEISNLQMQFENTKAALTMFETLFEINQYMNTNLDIESLLPMVEDVVKGMVGARYCTVILKETIAHTDPLFKINLSYHDLYQDNIQTTFVEDLSKKPLYNLDSGCLYIHKVDFEDDTYGYIIAYWDVPFSVTDKQIKFLSILSTQTGLCIKSARLVAKFKLLAIHDPLTGIYNRSYLGNIESTSVPALGECMVMFDLDNFKRINDTLGHAFGDEILKTFASILKSHADASGATCFKYGGEEFVLKCIGGESEGLRLANLILTQFKEQTGYTVSAGVSAIGESCKINKYSILLDLADCAMYISKQCGKNRATVSNADLQMFNKAGNDLSTALSQSFRRGSNITGILRLDVKNAFAMADEEVFEFQTELRGVLRVYDKVHVTESLSVLFLLDTQSPVKIPDVMHRIGQLMQEKYPNIAFSLTDCSRIFKEVAVHSTRVAEIVDVLSPHLNIETQELAQLKLACEWHDVGKLCIHPEIYFKPDKLTPAEYERIKFHAWLGCSIAKQNKTLRHCSVWILMHHENYDGNGYYGYKGDEIPLQAQILSLVDKLDALTEDRCYRKAFTIQQAVDILKAESNKFESNLFQTFITLIVKLYSLDTPPSAVH